MKLDSNLIWLLCRNLFFTLLQPGLVVGLFPFLLLKNKIDSMHPILSWDVSTIMACVIFLFGFVIMSDCIWRFAFQGKGTLSPADPTQNLVDKGLYRFSRNPMYLGVMTMLLGELIFCPTIYMTAYMAIIFMLFNMFIIYFEEPRLKRAFGNSYILYCQSVRRWL